MRSRLAGTAHKPSDVSTAPGGRPTNFERLRETKDLQPHVRDAKPASGAVEGQRPPFGQELSYSDFAVSTA
jgi:hypothetical protein